MNTCKVEPPPKTGFRQFMKFYYSYKWLHFNILFVNICVLHLCPFVDNLLFGGTQDFKNEYLYNGL